MIMIWRAMQYELILIIGLIYCCFIIPTAIADGYTIRHALSQCVDLKNLPNHNFYGSFILHKYNDELFHWQSFSPFSVSQNCYRIYYFDCFGADAFFLNFTTPPTLSKIQFKSSSFQSDIGAMFTYLRLRRQLKWSRVASRQKT